MNIYCCDCRVQLAKPTARYCPAGHCQFDEETAPPEVENHDRHPDDDDDDDIRVVPATDFKPNLRSKLPVKEVQTLRAKAIARDSNQRTSDKRQGSYGIRPANDNSVKKTLVVWLCERPPVKPQPLGLPLAKKLKIPIQLDSL